MTSLAQLLAEPEALVPMFPVEARDKGTASELHRQETFINLLSELGPKVMVYANVNAAKRGRGAQAQAKREGMRSGVFDVTCAWADGVAWIEFKNGTRPLSENQIEFGNDLVARNHRCAMFRKPESAIAWLRRIGAPIREARI